MRVLTISTLFPRPTSPGFGRFVALRVRELARLCDLTVAAPVPRFNVHGETSDAPLPNPLAGGLDVHYLRWFNVPGFASTHPGAIAKKVVSWARDQHKTKPFSVIDAQYGYPDSPVARQISEALGIPYVVTLRGSEVEHAQDTDRRAALSLSFQRAAAIIGVSKRLADFAVSLGADRAKTHVVPNGVDTSIFYPRNREELRAQLGLDRGAFHVLTAGHLIKLKGHHHAVRALMPIHGRNINARLWIAGGLGQRSSYEWAIRAAVEENGLVDNVTFLGDLAPEKLADYMAAVDVFCLASSREGWPNVVQESMACGTPVVAFDVGAAPEMLPSEDYGFVVPPDDIDMLTGALQRSFIRMWDRDAIAKWGARRCWQDVGQEAFAVLKAVAQQGR